MLESLPIPVPSEISAVTQEKWALFLARVGEGDSLAEAAAAVAVPATIVQGLIRSNKALHDAWSQTRLDARRKGLDIETIEAICVAIATGSTVRIACEQHGTMYHRFLQLVLQDAHIRAEYEEAKKIRAEMQADEIIDIADDDDGDTDFEGKGNSAAVKRSELRVKTRLEVMKANNRDKYSELVATQKAKGELDVKVSVNINHAERLEAARQRERQGRLPVTVEVTPEGKTEVVVDVDADDTGWLD